MTAQQRLTITAVRKALDEGTTPAEYLAQSLTRAGANAELGAFIVLADGGDGLAGGGPLAGVPFAVKDNIDTAELATTGGTNALRGSRPPRDAPVVTVLRAAGAQILGKTNLHELALGITSNNGSFGPVRHPQHPSRSPGGSSGGSAVAVAVGVVPFALGTDTGGSIRIPAAHCGLVGFRPTAGRWGAHGVIPLSSTRDTIGVVANTVADVDTVDRVVSSASRLVSTELRGLRLGVPREGFYDNLDSAVADRTERALEALAGAGVDLVEMRVEAAQELDAGCGFAIVFHEIARDLPRYLSGLESEYAELGLAGIASRVGSPDVRATLESILDQPVPESVYRECQAMRERLQAAYAAAFVRNRIAALVYPTVPLPAPPLGDDLTTLHNGREVGVFATSIQNTGPGSVAGVPSISLPNGLTPVGLPVGLSLESSAGSDRSLLSLAAAIEAVVSDLPDVVRQMQQR